MSPRTTPAPKKSMSAGPITTLTVTLRSQAYLGLEGWCLDVELRPGSQHSQIGVVSFMKRGLKQARTLVPKKKLLVRLDSAHDAIGNRGFFRDQEKFNTLSSTQIQCIAGGVENESDLLVLQSMWGKNMDRGAIWEK